MTPGRLLLTLFVMVAAVLDHGLIPASHPLPSSLLQRFLFPSYVNDKVVDLLGINACMDGFIGRVNPVPGA